MSPVLGMASNARVLLFFSLKSNGLSGTLPLELVNLSKKLTELDLSGNRLEGNLPPEWGNLTNLQWLYLSGNQLRGNIPETFTNLGIQSLDLSYNLLTAVEPVITFINQLDKGDWQGQTVPPLEVKAIGVNHRIQVQWTPIPYQSEFNILNMLPAGT